MDPGPPLRDIGCFALVAQRLSFSRAAAELHMSQPAMSQAIGRLERSLGVRLFERTSREVRLSPAGKALLPYADAMLEASAALVAEGARLARSARPTLRLAYPLIVGPLAARIALRLTRRKPAIDVELRASGWGAATSDLERGDISAAILSAPFPREFTTAARFHVTVGHLTVPAGDPLAAVSRIRPEQLSRQKILMPRNRTPGGMWARLAAQLRGPHQHHVVADDIDDFAAALDLVAAGVGLLPTPELLVKTIRRHDIRFVPLDAGDLRMMYGLVWSGTHASPELMTLVQTVQEALWTR